MAKVEVIYTELSQDCNNDHHLYALEFVSNETTKTCQIPLVCTRCGLLVVHTVVA
jgi:hypothetical protein